MASIVGKARVKCCQARVKLCKTGGVLWLPGRGLAIILRMKTNGSMCGDNR